MKDDIEDNEDDNDTVEEGGDTGLRCNNEHDTRRVATRHTIFMRKLFTTVKYTDQLVDGRNKCKNLLYFHHLNTFYI